MRQPASTRRKWRGLALGGLALLAAAPAIGDAPAPRPVLLELFTSQGCSSCPPADRLLDDVGRRADVLALAFHVDYWDYIGWADRFGSPAWTARQRDYARRHGFQVFTPQLVIDGRDDIVGSARADLLEGIERAKRQERTAAASIRRDGSAAELTVGALAGAAGDARGQLLLASFDGRRSTRIAGGENAGREIVYTHVVRSLRRLGEWRNEPLRLREPLRADDSGERLALIVQGDDGTVWALASTPETAPD